MTTLTLDTLRKAMESLKPTKPYLIAIWCIERDKQDLLCRIPGLKVVQDNDPQSWFTGVPIREWARFWHREGDTEPPVGTAPGFWLQMSDGNHLRLDERATPSPASRP